MIYYDKNGKGHTYPIGKESAKRQRKRLYVDIDGCKECGCTLFYVKTEKCLHCARQEASDFIGLVNDQMLLYGPDENDFYEINYNHDSSRVKHRGYFERLLKNKEYLPENEPITYTQRDAAMSGCSYFLTVHACKICGGVGIRNTDNQCLFCLIEKDRPTPRQAAREANERLYTPEKPCNKCGQIAPRLVSNTACTGCSPELLEPKKQSPRQAAIAAGEKYYTPDKPCPRCGERAPRTVANGICSACNPSAPPVASSADQQLIASAPTLVIDRERAKILGLKVYRTGNYCRRGHNGFRYVSNGMCVDCLKEKS